MTLRTIILEMHNTIYVIAFILSFGSVIREIYVAKSFEYNCKEVYYAKNIVTYYISALLVIQLTECCYYKINQHSYVGVVKTLIDCGVLLGTLLVCSGRMIDYFYKYALSNKPKLMKELDLNEAEKSYIICWSSVVTIITSFIFNYYLWTYALAIFLGRFLWFDTKKSLCEAFGEMGDKNQEIRDYNIVKIRTIVLLGGFLCTIVYVILRLVFHYTSGYIQ